MDIDSDEEITRLPLRYSPSDSAARRSPLGREKRKAEEGLFAPPALPALKRQKGDFNAAYLRLLNQDIQDASLGFIKARGDEAEEGYGYGDDEHGFKSSPTQIGAVVWSAAEKTAFFAAVGRLGRGDVARVAARIGTKSELEVRMYMAFLDAARQHPVAGEGKPGAGAGVGVGIGAFPAPQLASVNILAAVEIGAECAASLEAAADALALRQEGYEEGVERERWGARWRITGPIARILELALERREGRAESSETTTEQQRDSQQRSRSKNRDDDDESGKEEEEEDSGKSLGEMPCVEFFHVENWVTLSDRVFMNSTITDGNWRSMSEEDEPPAIRTTALADFHALALSVTKRLLFAAAYVAESRARKRVLDEPQRRLCPRIRSEDVKAAVSSLGMRQDSRKFWARCARRLQLDIVDDGEDSDDDYNQEAEAEDIEERIDSMDIDEHMSTAEPSDKNVEDPEQEVQESEEEVDDDYEIMSYDEVEAALGFQTSDIKGIMSSGPGSPETDDDDVFPSPEDESSASSPFEDPGPPDSEDEETREVEIEAEDDNDGLNMEAIDRDIEEAITSTAYTGGSRPLPALRSRIRAEHRLERDADHLDLKASAAAEARLWAVLRGDGDVKKK